ncbi:SDR family NAD(P)-dependent oxidoreductase [Amycolatopsis sp. NPDC051372]|uniref:SDR family NAD(P)-dependent oxidoreductase n=1 Tax=Amycolatopsis sp. NPDC051372 TaxID=3155669 RepID=UPI003444F6EB
MRSARAGRVAGAPPRAAVARRGRGARHPVHLVKCVVPAIVDRGHGRVLFTSSIAGAAPAPYQVVYAASKAFLTSRKPGSPRSWPVTTKWWLVPRTR